MALGNVCSGARSVLSCPVLSGVEKGTEGPSAQTCAEMGKEPSAKVPSAAPAPLHTWAFVAICQMTLLPAMP